MKNLKAKIKSNPKLKTFTIWMLQPSNRPRPRLWVRLILNPLVHYKARGSLIRRNTRIDTFPYNDFSIGKNSTIESFACINNAVGPVIIGDESRIGLSNTIIGPVKIGSNTNLAQNIVISGLNHGYEAIDIPPKDQPCTTSKITIGDGCWIGANATITAGVTLGKHTIVAAGSVVTKSFPGHCVIAGSPARIIKKYNPISRRWERVNHLKTKQHEAA